MNQQNESAKNAFSQHSLHRQKTMKKNQFQVAERDYPKHIRAIISSLKTYIAIISVKQKRNPSLVQFIQIEWKIPP